MSERLVLPTFFVIGAAKAGTTSFNHYLAAHPEIAMAEPKEPHLMLGPNYRERANAYRQHFRKDAPIRGDCSPRYSVYPTNPFASEHISELVPDARLIYLVRDPVERTIACYAQNVMHGHEDRPLEEAVRVDDSENYYVSGSRYATQVEVYLKRFSEDRMLIIDQDDLRTKRDETLRRAFEHVGADPDFRSDDFALELAVRGDDNVRLGKVGNRLKHGELNRLSRRFLPAASRRRLVSAARRVLWRGAVNPEADTELRSRLAEALAPEAERLRAMTGQTFAGWSV